MKKYDDVTQQVEYKNRKMKSMIGKPRLDARFMDTDANMMLDSENMTKLCDKLYKDMD